MMVDAELGAAATRKELLESIPRWRQQLSDLREYSTYGVGVARPLLASSSGS